ncbi:hypothetical protein BG011_009749 [Mortierella polycephala]|uniref:F-box domain-containing protein n=1 Tax=Mortierella polycephala TaxID=41804 RepID=A0A9P6U9Y2_9FUNG|nr:hypothetical protein BG011_009749 [Mortierella polycephala]
MDILEKSEHYSILPQIGSNLSLKDQALFHMKRTPLIQTLKLKSSAATKFSPLILSIPPGNTALPALTLTRRKRNTPYHASCFSPCDLPYDIFVYLLEFLSPSDLWKLAQVSRAMQMEVINFMSKVQRFKFSAVRILHQEHSNSVPRRQTLYECITFGASLPSFSSSLLNSCTQSNISIHARPKSTGQFQDRSEYWSAQARYLVATITEGTAYELQDDIPPNHGREAGTKSMHEIGGRHASAPSMSADQSVTNEETSIGAAATVATTASAASTDSSSVSSATSSSIMPLALSSTTLGSYTVASHITPSLSQLSHHMQGSRKQETEQTNMQPQEPLPMVRFNAIVDLLYDPNIVHVQHRRAIINCARYVSANISDTFGAAVGNKEPVDEAFHAKFQEQSAVNMGPYLIMFSPIVHSDEGNHDGHSPREEALTGSAQSKVITPPKKLANYFQVMLWHRCVSDLISLYNRVQDLHLDAPTKNIYHPEKAMPQVQPEKTVCCQDLTTPSSMRSSAQPSKAGSYPFCCHAHALVFTAQCPFSFVPYPIRAQFRRIVHKVQSVSHKQIWHKAFGDHRMPQAQRRRSIRYTGPDSRLHFCNSTTRSTVPATAPGSDRKSNDDEALVQRRYRVEERIRQDTLVKQELLTLCHMACGLFLAEDMSRDAPPTIMSLLRQGSPWSKGVWREGEWRHEAIDSGCQLGSAHPPRLDTLDRHEAWDQGWWQKICIATIEFLANENLTWGGNRTNAELSRLRTTNNSGAWTYHE